MTFRRRSDNIACLVLGVAILCTVCGVSACVTDAQSQDYINATTAAQLSDLTRRIGDLESAIRWGIGALVAQLSAHALQVWSALSRRADHR